MVDAKLEQALQALITRNVREMNAYHITDASGLIKLDAMENPYAWDAPLKQQWLEILQQVEVNRYPDPQAKSIKNILFKKLQLTADSDILFGNGSDELIQLIIMAIAGSGRPVMAPSPTFVMYKIIAQYLNVNFIDVPLNADFSMDIASMIIHIEKYQPAVIFLATPNNPTANVFQDCELEAIMQAASGLVVIDEAYFAFTESDQLHWLKKYPNALVMRTFSKSGLAGLRLGFLIGAHQWIHQLDKLRLPYNINVLTQASVAFILQHDEILQRQSQTICAQRNILLKALLDFKVFECFPTQANFISVRCLQHDAQKIFEDLKKHGILIKCLHGSHPLLTQCLRITVGKDEENKILLKALHKIL